MSSYASRLFPILISFIVVQHGEAGELRSYTLPSENMQQNQRFYKQEQQQSLTDQDLAIIASFAVDVGRMSNTDKQSLRENFDKKLGYAIKQNNRKDAIFYYKLIDVIDKDGQP